MNSIYVEAALDHHANADAVAVLAARLADEGLPIGAIARSLKIPTQDVRDLLREALEEGIIVELPREEWPPGLKRNSFGPPLDNFVSNDTMLRIACCRLFGATHQQAIVLATLLKRPEATKEQLHAAVERDRTNDKPKTHPKLVDVLICHLRRKLRPWAARLYRNDEYKIIKTMWGTGYLIDAKERIALVKELNDFMRQASNLVEAEAQAA